jgi:hypothetical protein
MTVKEEPIIEKYTGLPFTEITFIPDYPKFGMIDLNADMIALFKKRTYDMAFTSQNNLSVWFNETKLELASCLDYIKLYLPDPENTELAFTIPHARWYVAACMAPNFQFNQVSFVNGICTSRGGRHVDYVTKQITSKLAAWILKKKKVEVRESFIKDNLMIFINSLIVNPSFDSQTKETLTTNMKVRSLTLDTRWAHKLVDMNTLNANYKNQGGFVKVEEIVCNLKSLSLNIIEPLLKEYPGFLPINSAFRATTSAGGKSQHMVGEAIDIQWPGISTEKYMEIANWVLKNLPVDQIIYEHTDAVTNTIWLHISHRKDGVQRGQAQTMKDGIYTAGFKNYYPTKKPK